jgi:hypothetical protein
MAALGCFYKSSILKFKVRSEKMTRARKQPMADLEEVIPILISHWRRTMQLSGPGDALQTREFRSVVAEIKALQEGVFEGKGLIGSDYFAKKATLGAYTLYHWLIHYQQGLSLINELPEVPQRVLDVCAGPCPFAFAALRHGAQEVIAIDKSNEALQWGAQICGRYGLPLTVRAGHVDGNLKGISGQFDLIIVAHALGELFPNMSEKGYGPASAFLEQLMQRLTPQGHLLVVDSSYSAGNRMVLSLRDDIVAKGGAIQAPCIWRGPCPARARSDSPCFAQRTMEKPPLVRELQRAASINLSSLKMSYLIARAPGAAWPSTGDKQLYRVISPPFEGHYGQTFYLCGVGGKKKLAAAPGPLPEEARPYKFLKRGELISIEGAADRGSTLEVVDTTSLRVVAACGKAWQGEESN